jgi:DNA-binding transcriptional LysR family regulator
MDLRALRYFVAVAEELHFSRAAARLHLAQSALSTQIRRLEEEIGGPLLVRTTRRVTLTPAGEALLTDARGILASSDAALARARSLARGEGASLVVGTLGPAAGGLLAPLLARFGSVRPDVRVEVRALEFDDAVLGLREGRADVAFGYAPLTEPDILTIPLLSEPRVVVLPQGHRLARRAALVPADLAEETFITHSDSVPQEWRDFWMLVDELGRRPRASPYLAANIQEWLTLIGRGEGIDTCPGVISRYFAWPDVCFVPLRDAAPATLLFTRLRDQPNPIADVLTELALEVAAAATHSDATPYAPVSAAV